MCRDISKRSSGKHIANFADEFVEQQDGLNYRAVSVIWIIWHDFIIDRKRLRTLPT